MALLFKVHLVYTTLSKNMNPMEDNLPPEDKLIDDIRKCNHREFAYEDFSGRVIVNKAFDKAMSIRLKNLSEKGAKLVFSNN